ncbi:MAG: hypothetical protein IT447_12975 [Phycisphaerales bacterium]|jgi:hypothetical protein|nr:hypothetical protein [Phycisphaerales bacterium]
MLKVSLTFSITLLALAGMSALAQVDYQNAPQKPASVSRERWYKIATSTENLALHKQVVFSPIPDDTLTSDENDPYDLTDGKLSAREDDRLWFEKDAVGWKYASNGVNMQIDLGAVQPVGRVAIRFLGGAEQRGLLYPNEIRIVGSDDGVHYYTIATQRKLLPSEKILAQKDPESYFFFPEPGVAATETFVLGVHRNVRYIGLTVVADGDWVFTDQIAILKEVKPEQAKSLSDGLTPTQFIIKGIAMVPRQEEMVITTNIQTPNYFLFRDARKNKTPNVRFYMDLPDCLNVVPTRGKAVANNTPNKGITRWVVEDFYDPKIAEPYWSMYITLKDGRTLPKEAIAVLSSDDPASGGNVVKVPLRAVEIPVVPKIDRLVVSMTWMQELITWARKSSEPQIPNIYHAFAQMGFNMVPSFPRYFSESELPILRKMIEDARAQGLKIDYNESSFHTMTTRHADKPEIYNIVDGKQGKYVCPSYTGQYYQEDIDDVRKFARMIHPDQVDHDIELWYYPSQEAEHCSRCQEAFKKSGLKTFDEYLQSQGTRMMRDLSDAVAGTAPDGSNPPVGLYNVHATSGIYEYVYNFDQIFPKYIQISEPSLYVQNRAQLVHDVIRANYEKLKTNAIIPWLTTGTYGEFPSRYLEPIILESFLNGSRGIGYFMFLDFDPMDFYYHAATLKMIAPYQALIADGKPVGIESSNANLTCSAWGNDKQALVLVGNYAKAPDGKSTIAFLGKQVDRVLDVKEQKDLSPADLTSLDVAPDTHRLFHVTFK